MTEKKKISLVECPRDAMQGWKNFIPTDKKIAYINALLKVGFDTIDFGSFVSPKAIPQMADTKEVIAGLDTTNSRSKLLAIVANVRGAEEAVVYDQIDCLGYPFSISPTFQMRNANSTVQESFERVEAIQDLCLKNGKQLVLYISMGFGNPYRDAYNEEVVMYWVDKMVKLGIEVVSMADTVGLATADQVSSILEVLIPKYNNTVIGVHLHSTISNWQQKVQAAVMAGSTRFDGALKGIGGCPMAGDDLVGNMDTELMIPYFESECLLVDIDKDALKICSLMASEIFV
jgi:hydroxymethylglutaryl-CoA lyase